MAVYVVGFLLILAMSGYSDANYCVCNTGLSDSVLQKNIDYACGAGADCTQIQQNGPCFNPNTVRDHCNYAVNSYYQRRGQAVGSCDFQNTATVTQTAPSTTTTCVFPSGPSTGGTPIAGGTPTTGTPGTSGTPTTGTPIPGGTPNMGGGTTVPGSSMTPPFGLGPTGFPSSTDSSAGVKLSSQNVLVSMSVIVISGFICPRI
ncbi:plasmodesmata callose-binding protein 3 [Phtheirospermum japonicum]|uniref:Plasmodesmata callose-binding protein 3 n=1 Tax=Phtheirospermum japonicum TaxID=374723 RepID=A0A830BZT0_9LAMI|nr:plasmodesmata callose-binding protein 3 [Phtheirospermum japonicum]